MMVSLAADGPSWLAITHLNVLIISELLMVVITIIFIMTMRRGRKKYFQTTPST